MKEYTKPTILSNEDMAEGVFAGSGSCYDVTVKNVQRQSEHTYIIQADLTHHGAGVSTERTFVINFDNIVKFVSVSNYVKHEGDGTTTLAVTLNHHNNPNENIGLGDLTVTCDADSLSIISCKCINCNES